MELNMKYKDKRNPLDLEGAGLAGSKAGKALREELIELIELGSGKLDVSKASQSLQKVMKQLERDKQK